MCVCVCVCVCVCGSYREGEEGKKIASHWRTGMDEVRCVHACMCEFRYILSAQESQLETQ